MAHIPLQTLIPESQTWDPQLFEDIDRYLGQAIQEAITAGEGDIIDLSHLATINLSDMRAGVQYLADVQQLGIMLGSLVSGNLQGNWAYRLASQLPTIFKIRDGITAAISFFFAPKESITRRANPQLDALWARHVYQSLRWWQWAANISGFSADNIGTITVSGDTGNLQHELTRMQGQIQDLQGAVADIRAELAHITNAPNRAAISLQDQVNILFQDMQVVKSAVQAEAHDINQLSGEQAAQAQTLTRLQTELHGVSRAQTSYQDYLAMNQAQINGVSNGLADTQAQVSQNTQALRDLSPLAVLTLAGSVGIKNLQKLEKNPCQCPSLGNMGQIFWDALVADQVMANGF